MQNVQRIVDERDSYLESIIELQQDKDYLSFKLNSCLSLNTNCNEATLKQLNTLNNGNTTNVNSNSLNLNSPNGNVNINSNGNCCNNNTSSSNGNLVDLVVGNGVKNMTSCSNGMNMDNNLVNTSSLIELSEPQALLVLIESIYKEIASANTIIESASSFKNVSEHLLSGDNGLSENVNGDMTASGDMPVFKLILLIIFKFLIFKFWFISNKRQCQIMVD